MVDSGKISLSVFFPCHNEEGNIQRVISETLKVMPKISDDYEVIIVNDGSVDKTAEIADQLASEHDCVKVVHHQKNLGYGGALQSGFKAAAKEWVFYTDGDGQFDVGELVDLISLTNDYDIITCYRIGRKDRLMRKINAWAWGKLVNLVFHLHLKDIDCAFKLYKRKLFDEIEMHSMGALIDTEILARAQRKGYSMVQRGVSHYPRLTGEESGGNIKVILRAFKELFELRHDIRSSK